MIHFVGAGCGAKDLITLRGYEHIKKADVIVYAGSLVNKELLDYNENKAMIYDSSLMTLDEVMSVLIESEKKGLYTVRLHTGDPAIFGAIKEQMDELDNNDLEYDITLHHFLLIYRMSLFAVDIMKILRLQFALKQHGMMRRFLDALSGIYMIQ